MFLLRRKVLVSLLAGLCVALFYGVLNWTAEPTPSQAARSEGGGLEEPDQGYEITIPPDLAGIIDAQLANIVCDGDDCHVYTGGGGGGQDPGPLPEPDPPERAIVFVIDSSQSMFPRIGPDYFELAKEGIADFFDLPGLWSDDTYTFGILQFPQLDAAQYESPTNWIPMTQMYTEARREELIQRALNLEPSGHYSAGLMEAGIREATQLLQDPNQEPSLAGAEKYIILLSTGEYRLPSPCPPACYGQSETACNETNVDCADATAYCYDDELCNRACHIRDVANAAREAGITVNTVRLGPDWHRSLFVPNGCEEKDEPYKVEEEGEERNDYCQQPAEPGRDGFLNEIANVANCASPQPQGNFARIAPLPPFSAEPGTARDISTTLADWLCAWYPPDAGGGGKNDVDGDEHANPCDNCPRTPNPEQRDCDRNGIGEACQASNAATCDDGVSAPSVYLTDYDNDGICFGADVCPDGDDCLVSDWIDELACDYSGRCDCDCDNDDESDLCRAAVDCTGDPTLCEPFPAVCVPDDENGYIETFDDLAVAPDPIEAARDSGWWLTADGWMESDGGDPPVETWHAGAAITAEGDPEISQLELSVFGHVEEGFTWLAKTPGQQLPLGECISVPAFGEPDRGNWSIFGIEIDLQIDAMTAGVAFDLYVLDSCGEDLDDAERIHLRLSGDGVPTNLIKIEYEDADLESVYGTSDNFSALRGPTAVGDATYYPRNDLITLRFLVNTNALYYYDSEYGCLWYGDSETVQIFYYKDGGSTTNKYHTAASRVAELGRLVPEESRGVKVAVGVTRTTEPAEGDTATLARLSIDNIHVYPADRCKWWHGDDVCDGDDEVCAYAWKNGSNQWACFELPDCGNGSIDPGEQCDPGCGNDCGFEDWRFCDATCHWVCGDGVVQGAGTGHCDELTALGYEGPCEAGDEECDWASAAEGTSASGAWWCNPWTCEIIDGTPPPPPPPPTPSPLCGNGVVDDAYLFWPAEECDRGPLLNGDPVSGCTEDCKIATPQ